MIKQLDNTQPQTLRILSFDSEDSTYEAINESYLNQMAECFVYFYCETKLIINQTYTGYFNFDPQYSVFKGFPTFTLNESK